MNIDNVRSIRQVRHVKVETCNSLKQYAIVYKSKQKYTTVHNSLQQRHMLELNLTSERYKQVSFSIFSNFLQLLSPSQWHMTSNARAPSQ